VLEGQELEKEKEEEKVMEEGIQENVAM